MRGSKQCKCEQKIELKLHLACLRTHHIPVRNPSQSAIHPLISSSLWHTGTLLLILTCISSSTKQGQLICAWCEAQNHLFQSRQRINIDTPQIYGAVAGSLQVAFYGPPFLLFTCIFISFFSRAPQEDGKMCGFFPSFPASASALLGQGVAAKVVAPGMKRVRRFQDTQKTS